MQIEPQILNAIMTIILACIITIGLVAILAPAALSVILKPLIDLIKRLVDALESRNPPSP